MYETKIQGNNEIIKHLNDLSLNSGRSITWHIVNGGDIYRRIFITCIQIMKKNDDDIVIEKSRFTRLTGAPSSALNYPLFKYSQEDYFIIKNNKIFIHHYHREIWGELCRTLQSTL